MPSKNSKRVPICIMIGGGSKLPAIIKAANNSKSKFYISLVVSHKSFSPGIDFAIAKKTPAIYFKLPDYRNRIFDGSNKARANYMKQLGWFITQREYAPKFLIFAGWDLVMDKNFFNFFKAKIGNGFAAINLHPAILPIRGEKSKIKLPDGSSTPVIKGEQKEVLKTVLKNKLSCFGPSVHYMVPTKFDTGKVIKRAFIKVGKAKTISDLRKKLMPIEDKILVEAIEEIVLKI